MQLVTLLISVGLFTTLVALAIGLLSMANGGRYDEQHAEQLMFARVASQGITFVLLLIALYLISG